MCGRIPTGGGGAASGALVVRGLMATCGRSGWRCLCFWLCFFFQWVAVVGTSWGCGCERNGGPGTGLRSDLAVSALVCAALSRAARVVLQSASHKKCMLAVREGE